MRKFVLLFAILTVCLTAGTKDNVNCCGDPTCWPPTMCR